MVYVLENVESVPLAKVLEQEKAFKFSDFDLGVPDLVLGPGNHQVFFCLDAVKEKKPIVKKAPIKITILNPSPQPEKDMELPKKETVHEKMLKNPRKKHIAALITKAMEEIGYSVFIGGAAAINIRFGDHREINDLDFKMAKKESGSKETNLEQTFKDNPDAVHTINHKLRDIFQDEVNESFAMPKDDVNRIDGVIGGVEISFIRVRSASYEDRGEKVNGISALHGTDLVLDKALAIAVRNEKWKSDLFDLIHALLHTPQGMDILLTNLETKRGTAYEDTVKRRKEQRRRETGNAEEESGRTGMSEKLMMQFFNKMKEYASQATVFQQYVADYFPVGSDTDLLGTSQAKSKVSKETERYMEVFKQLVSFAKSTLIIQAGNMTGDMFGVSAALLLNSDAHVLIIPESNDARKRDRTSMIQSYYLDTVKDPSRIHILSPVADASAAYTNYAGREAKDAGKTQVPAEQVKDRTLPGYLQFPFKQLPIGDATGMVAANWGKGSSARDKIQDHFGVRNYGPSLQMLKKEEEHFLGLKDQLLLLMPSLAEDGWSIGTSIVEDTYEEEDLITLEEKRTAVKNQLAEVNYAEDKKKKTLVLKMYQSLSVMSKLIQELDAMRAQRTKYKHVETFLEKKGVVSTGNMVVLWSRFSGKKGGPHAQHDTSFTGIRQMVELAKSIGSTVILTGDQAQTTGKMDELIAETGAINLVEFWNDSAWRERFPENRRSDQFLLFHYLHEKGSMKHLGFRSGNLESYALLGHQVRYMEEEGNQQATRMEKWSSEKSSIGYDRIIVDQVPTLTGQWVVEHTEKSKAEPKPFWIEEQSNPKPELEGRRGFSTKALEAILDYFIGPSQTEEGSKVMRAAWRIDLQRRHQEDIVWASRLARISEEHGENSDTYQQAAKKFHQHKKLTLDKLDDIMKEYLRGADEQGEEELWLKELIKRAKQEVI